VIEYVFTVVTSRHHYSEPVVERDETRWLTVCGLGASDQPSCTEAVAVSCTDFDGRVQRASWYYRDGQLVLESNADPAQCARGELTLGSFPLEPAPSLQADP
jgi:hypothetical protein